MAREIKVDLCVIGAGPGGIALARQARALGASVVLVDGDGTGGTPLHWGGLAAGALAASARRAQEVRTARRLGIETYPPDIEFSRITARTREVLDASAPDNAEAILAAEGIEVIGHDGAFTGRRSLLAGETLIRARRFVIATGAATPRPEIAGIDAVPYLTPETASGLTEAPEHLLIHGGGPVALMLAQAYLRLGCAVTLVDPGDPLSDADPELADIVMRRLRAEGLALRTNTSLTAVSTSAEGLRAHLRAGADETTVSGSHLLIAPERVPQVESLSLRRAGVRMNGPAPAVGRSLRTSNWRIYCIGDALGGFSSVAAARYQARMVADRVLGFSLERLDPRRIPVLVHTDPQIGWVGLGEGAARRRYKGKSVLLRQPVADLSLARLSGHTEGVVKVVAGPGGRIVGAGVAGTDVADLLAFLALAIDTRMTIDHLARAIPPHPAHAEALAGLAETWRRSFPPRPLARPLAALRRVLP
ncbi:dihydrolipoyl dehydrogenase family protein [Pelagibacterium montanilacus]|uniref:dihydrolipoyl dehydrogenase family protein n=1 Tax=Pelagibacterium montanilacus TaxID=2185280 RepID=UPI0013E00DA5|nr:NAD(P)/FAD-dependent oxidoreductase [Pelagibacterium montanilacus]